MILLIFQKWKISYWEWKIIIVNIKKKPSYVDKNGVFLISRNNDNIEKDNIVKKDENDNTQKNKTEKDENIEKKEEKENSKKKKNLLLKKTIVENLMHVSQEHFKTT